jgi:Holliday junction resolvase
MNGRSSKRKGSSAEREVVNLAKAAGLTATRAYASNGRALGHTEDVDAEIAGYRIQVKRRARIASYVKPPEGADMTLIREDRGPWLAVIPYTTLLDLLENHGA